MIRAVFLGHSGFLVELPRATLLFDWWKGKLPALRPGLPLLVFASHHHPDHFRPKIFRLDDGPQETRFLLGKDIKLTPRNLERWEAPETAVQHCLTLNGGQTAEPFPGIKVEALSSTDEGAAFLATADTFTVFHAGDLNWWHWAGEDPAWNQNMAANFKRYTEPLRGRRIDLAILPLDPRLGEDAFWGPQYFLELADIQHVLFMHQWEEFDFTKQFLARWPAYSDKVIPITENGQVITL